MENMTASNLMNELALALIYLTVWKEKGHEMLRAWKGYDFTILDQLKEQGLIDFSYNAKSLYLSHEGEEKAKQLVEKFKQCK
jgi:small-conductance mechanosensitive channel